MNAANELLDSVIDAPGVVVYHGDALRLLAELPAASVDAVVCDPPYAIRADSTLRALVNEARTAAPEVDGPDVESALGRSLPRSRNLNPETFAAATMLGQQSSNWHEQAAHSRGYADNDNAVFAAWVGLWAAECLRVLKPGGHMVAFGGTRTWHRLATAVEDAGFEIRDSLAWLYASGCPKSLNVGRAVAQHHHSANLTSTLSNSSLTSGESDNSWAGWYTGVEPAHEPIVLARKPVEGTVATNVLKHSTGALNIDGTRLSSGLWPTNVFLDENQAALLGAADEIRESRYFFVAKPGRAERVIVDGVAHPTVKPLALMRELVRLATAPGGVVLDPFAGSGTTIEAALLEGRLSIGIERDPAYLPLIRERIGRSQQSRPGVSPEPLPSDGNQPVSEPSIGDTISASDEELTLFALD